MQAAKTSTLWLISMAILGAWSAAPAAATLWSGPDLTYAQPAPDPTDPANQDRLAPNVWLTRAATQGLFNVASETFYTHDSSPADTEWAYGDLANYASLSFSPWEIWNGKNPPSMVDQSAVLHLISENIYLSIEFTSWGGPGGGFSYVRSTPLVGDFNQDGHVDAADIPAMELALANLPSYESTYSVTETALPSFSDINGDGKFNNPDLQALLNSLQSGGGSLLAVPEPSCAVLFGLASAICLCWRCGAKERQQ
ncbi:MAG TPA: dockerin type I domain-containing protein [Pirellulales bacterium]|jgi:hypothetical protein|nr:dockerin type I domain-containing protein [Pirellulales bacterium]